MSVNDVSLKTLFSESLRGSSKTYYRQLVKDDGTPFIYVATESLKPYAKTTIASYSCGVNSVLSAYQIPHDTPTYDALELLLSRYDPNVPLPKTHSSIDKIRDILVALAKRIVKPKSLPASQPPKSTSQPASQSASQPASASVNKIKIAIKTKPVIAVKPVTEPIPSVQKIAPEEPSLDTTADWSVGWSLVVKGLKTLAQEWWEITHDTHLQQTIKDQDQRIKELEQQLHEQQSINQQYVQKTKSFLANMTN